MLTFNYIYSVFCRCYFASRVRSQLKLVNQMNTFSFNLLVNIFTSNFEFVQFSVSVPEPVICNWKMEFGHNNYFIIITIYSQWLLYVFILGISLYFI